MEDGCGRCGARFPGSCRGLRWTDLPLMYIEIGYACATFCHIISLADPKGVGVHGRRTRALYTERLWQPHTSLDTRLAASWFKGSCGRAGRNTASPHDRTVSPAGEFRVLTPHVLSGRCPL